MINSGTIENISKIIRRMKGNGGDFILRWYSGGIFLQNTSPVEKFEDNLMLTWNSGVSEFSESMENDLGIPGAVHALQELARGILKAAKGRRDVKEAQEMLRKYSLVFGLTLGSETPEKRVVEGWNAKKR